MSITQDQSTGRDETREVHTDRWVETEGFFDTCLEVGELGCSGVSDRDGQGSVIERLVDLRPQGHQTVHRGQFGLNDRAPKGGGKAHLILQFPVNPRIPRQECEQRAEAYRCRIRPCGDDGCRSEQYVVGGIDFTRGRMFGVHELVQHLRQREARVRAMSMGVIVGKHDEVRNSHLF